MEKRNITRFFKILDQELGLPANVILTGAGAGTYMGQTRTSVDIDFEIATVPRNLDKLESAIARTIRKTGIAVNYSENIGGWSMIAFLDYRRHAVLIQKIGKIQLRLMAPEYWTIGKMVRFGENDLRDLEDIIIKQKLRPDQLIVLWAKAIEGSSLSIELGQFRKNVCYFLTKYGNRVWGKNFKPQQAVETFLLKIKRKK